MQLRIARRSLLNWLGILTLLNLVPIGLALAHQAVAILALSLAVIHAERVVTKRDTAPARITAAAR